MCYPVHPVLLENPSSPPQVVLPPPHQSRIAGRVRSHLPQWKKISGPWHTKTIMDGIPLQWVQDPPPFNRPFDSAISLRSRSKEFEGCSNTLQHYLEIGSVVPLPNQDETDGVWSTFFPVAKKGTDKLRGCIDLRTINPFLRYEHFKMEGTHTLASMLRRRDWMTKIDLSDFYMHLPIAEADRKFFRFMFNGIKYECVAMPFGLAPAPRIATKFAASNQVPPPQRCQMHGLHRRHHHSGSQSGPVPQAHPAGSGSSTRPGFRDPTGQAPRSASAIRGVS